MSKKCRKSPKGPEKESKWCQNQCSGTFSTVFDTLGGAAREDLFVTFGDFAAGGVETPVYGDCNRKPCTFSNR